MNHCWEKKGHKEEASTSKERKWKNIVLVKFFYSLSMTLRNKISGNDFYEKGWQEKRRAQSVCKG